MGGGDDDKSFQEKIKLLRLKVFERKKVESLRRYLILFEECQCHGQRQTY